MDARLKRFSPYALIFAGVALLGAFGWYIVNNKFDLAFQITLGLAVLGVAVAILFDPDGARQFITGREARYGSNALVITVACLGFIIVANVLAYQNDQRLDLTQDQLNTLAVESLDVITKLPGPVEARLFATGQQPYDTQEKLLKLYVEKSQGKFSYTIVNPNNDPVGAAQANVNRDVDIVMVMDGRMEKARTLTEEGITGAMVRLMSNGQRKIYFLTGHGEPSINTSGDGSFAGLKSLLEAKNYTLAELNLLTTASVPEDAGALFAGGAQNPLTAAEVSAIKAYADRGGVLVVMQDPTILTKFGDSPDLLAQYLETEWGVKLENDLIVDLVGQSQLQQPYIAVGTQFGSHPIVSGLVGSAVLFDRARSLSFVLTASGASPEMLVSTTADSWGETDLASISVSPQPDEGVDNFGPLILAAAVENFTTQSRLVVFGSSGVAVDPIIDAYGNGDLVVGAVDWVTGQENLITLSSKTTTTRTLKLTPSPYIVGLALLISVFVLPAIPLVMGITAYIRRRRR